MVLWCGSEAVQPLYHTLVALLRVHLPELFSKKQACTHSHKQPNTHPHNDWVNLVFFLSEEEENGEEPRSSSWTLLHAFIEFHGAPQVKKSPSYCERKTRSSPMSTKVTADLCQIKKSSVWMYKMPHFLHASLKVISRGVDKLKTAVISPFHLSQIQAEGEKTLSKT